MRNLIMLLLFWSTFYTSLAQDYVCRIDTVYTYEYIPGSELKYLVGRILNVHNANNLLIEETRQTYNYTNNLFSTVSKVNFTFDTESRLIERTSANWNSSTNTWTGQQKKTIAYSQSAPNEIETLYQWTANGWLGYYQFHRSYNAQGKLTESLTKLYNDLLEQWINYEKVMWVYDANGNDIESTYQSWNVSNTWVTGWKSTRTYNSQQKITHELRENWNQNSSIWVNSYQVNFTYNSSEKLIERLYQTWDASIGAFINNQRTVYNYPEPNAEIRIVANWNLSLNFWENLYRTSLMNNSSGNEIENQFEVWNSAQNSWNNWSFQFNIFDENNFLLATENFDDWNSQGDFYDSRVRTEYVCSSVIQLGYDDLSLETISVFPNPTNPYESLSIQSPINQEFVILDALGKQHMNGILHAGANQIEINAFQPGIYFIKTTQATVKLIVQ